MKIVIVDGQGGKLGKLLVEQLKQEYFAHARVLCSKEQLESSFENEASVGKAYFMKRATCFFSESSAEATCFLRRGYTSCAQIPH